MTLENARFIDAGQTTIALDIDGVASVVPADPGNRHYAAIVVAGLTVAPYVVVVTADDVRAEAGRRITSLLPVHRQLNMQARATELAVIGATNWTPEETTEAAIIQGMRNWIAAIRAASNSMEADPPADYADDSRWPAYTGEPGEVRAGDPVADQIRYETALRAVNGNSEALSLLTREAGILGMSAGSLAQAIIASRQQREVAVMDAYADRAEGGQ